MENTQLVSAELLTELEKSKPNAVPEKCTVISGNSRIIEISKITVPVRTTGNLNA